MKPSAILIHFPKKDYALDHIKDLGFKYQETKDEYDVIVDDVPYDCLDGTYQDPDEQLCEHYGIEYNFINCMEALY